MRNKYGKAAVDAVRLIQDDKYKNPIYAWEYALSKYFPVHSSSWKKGCPRNTFLGLCEEGKVKGVSKGKYENSKKNKEYGLGMLKILKQNPDLIEHKILLWKKTVGGSNKTHNSQVDVVIALWESGVLI